MALGCVHSAKVQLWVRVHTCVKGVGNRPWRASECLSQAVLCTLQQVFSYLGWSGSHALHSAIRM